MKYITNSLRLLFISISLFAAANKVIAQSWNPSFTIGTGSGNYAFSYNQIPEQLVQLYPAAIPKKKLYMPLKHSAKRISCSNPIAQMKWYP